MQTKFNISDILSMYLEGKMTEGNVALGEFIPTMLDKPEQFVHGLLIEFSRLGLSFNPIRVPSTELEAFALLESLDALGDRYLCALYLMRIYNAATTQYVKLVLDRLGVPD